MSVAIRNKDTSDNDLGFWIQFHQLVDKWDRPSLAVIQHILLKPEHRRLLEVICHFLGILVAIEALSDLHGSNINMSVIGLNHLIGEVR